MDNRRRCRRLREERRKAGNENRAPDSQGTTSAAKAEEFCSSLRRSEACSTHLKSIPVESTPLEPTPLEPTPLEPTPLEPHGLGQEIGGHGAGGDCNGD